MVVNRPGESRMPTFALGGGGERPRHLQAVVDMLEWRDTRPGALMSGSAEWARTHKGDEPQPTRRPVHDGLSV